MTNLRKKSVSFDAEADILITGSTRNTVSAAEEVYYQGDESAADFSEEDSSTREGSFEVRRERRQSMRYVLPKDDDSSNVRRSQLCVALMLFTTAALVVSSTYIFLDRNLEEEFKNAFEFSAQTIADAAEFTASASIESMQILSDEFTREALRANISWPWFTVQNFEILARHTRETTEASMVFFLPNVVASDRLEWEDYSVRHQSWYSESLRVEELGREWAGGRLLQISSDRGISDVIFRKVEDNPGGTAGDTTPEPDELRLRYAPVWQISPPPTTPSLVNYNFLADSSSGRLMSAIDASGGQVVVSELLKSSTLRFLFQGMDPNLAEFSLNVTSRPHSITMAPVFENFERPTAEEIQQQKLNIVGYAASIVPWDLYLSDLLPLGTDGVYAVLSNSCGQTVTYVINGPQSRYLGTGDRHEEAFNDYKQSHEIKGFGSSNAGSRKLGQCDYRLDLYPSIVFQEDYSRERVFFFTAVLCAFFLATSLVFYVFVRYVQRRQFKTMTLAMRTSAIVASLFPANVRERIMKDAEEQAKNEVENKSGINNSFANSRNMYGGLAKQKLKTFLADNDDYSEGVNLNETGNHVGVFGSKPIADLFPETTIMFADLVGFTAWSSTRQPDQVFTLLETIYHGFDQIARKRKIFKVETVGDCYVAVAGLPERRKDHAVAMCRFANECYNRLRELTASLEQSLGPDTGDLTMRFGLHSGPVTAGVLRGERARFQLFGDTMNTASRMESNGKRDKIHISSDTAELLRAAGREHWLIPREDKIVAKGKGEMSTFWVVIAKKNSTDETSSYGDASDDSNIEPENVHELDDKAQRLIAWNTELFLGLLQRIVARREALGNSPYGPDGSDSFRVPRSGSVRYVGVVNEVREVISLPGFDAVASKREKDPSTIELKPEIADEVKDYVTTIALMYRANAFHNFEHVSHVSMSVTKLLSRIVAPSDEIETQAKGIERAPSQRLSSLHDHTYGITSDPLTQFACVFSALIHDVDHTGVPNSQLIKENSMISQLYNNKSVAEQNSVDLAWELLMDPKFKTFRSAIYGNEDEFTRFRQLVVNAVMATDIMDKDLKALRNARWDRAFKEVSEEEAQSRENINRKATIVIEHLIQASDIAHTMQHWHIYRKWNERLFDEMYKAFLQGRSEADPAEKWYEGEIGFFDFYIIPLARKLKDCGVFGVSSVEYLNYAEKNRAEWESRGREIVADMVARRSPTGMRRRGSLR